MKPNIEQLPCFNQVAQVIGRTQARIELFKAVGWKKWFDKNQHKFLKIQNDGIAWSFLWRETPQGSIFWDDINEGRNQCTGEKVE